MKLIEGFENYYITEEGKVWSEKSQKFMKPHLDKYGYEIIAISEDSYNRKKFKVHRLVAKAFLPNPEDKPMVCHKNHDRADNRVENLVWGTHKENMQMSVDDDRFISVPRPTRQKIRAMYNTGKYTMQQLAAMFGIGYNTVNRITKEIR